MTVRSPEERTIIEQVATAAVILYKSTWSVDQGNSGAAVGADARAPLNGALTAMRGLRGS